MRLSLKIALVRSGLTQRHVSIETRIPETRLSDIVRGRGTPTAAEREALSRVLAQPITDLFPSEPDPGHAGAAPCAG
jgi:transcriptional regulator with XRE-family HTH domain